MFLFILLFYSLFLKIEGFFYCVKKNGYIYANFKVMI